METVTQPEMTNEPVILHLYLVIAIYIPTMKCEPSHTQSVFGRA